MSIPAEALCRHEGCGHRFDEHTVPGPGCETCHDNLHRGYPVDPYHAFIQRKLAGGAYTPAQENEIYRKALAGE